MVREEETKGERADTDFKQALFVHDPERYFNMFEKPDPDAEVEQITPMDDSEMTQALEDMRRRGYIS